MCTTREGHGVRDVESKSQPESGTERVCTERWSRQSNGTLFWKKDFWGRADVHRFNGT